MNQGKLMDSIVDLNNFEMKIPTPLGANANLLADKCTKPHR
jgi:hypothetical protein